MDKSSETTIINTLQSVWADKLQGVILYGSRARGDHRPDSDFDLGVLLDGRADPVLVWDTAQSIASQLKQDVDLIDLHSATTVLQKEIIACGRWLQKKDAFACDLFEVHVISMYQQLQYDRRGILEDIRQRVKNG